MATKTKKETADPVEETAARDAERREDSLKDNPQYDQREDPETPGTAENDEKLAQQAAKEAAEAAKAEA